MVEQGRFRIQGQETHMKFSHDWPTGLKNILFEKWRTDGNTDGQWADRRYIMNSL